jgi:hypothetical protein
VFRAHNLGGNADGNFCHSDGVVEARELEQNLHNLIIVDKELKVLLVPNLEIGNTMSVIWVIFRV